MTSSHDESRSSVQHSSIDDAFSTTVTSDNVTVRASNRRRVQNSITMNTTTRWAIATDGDTRRVAVRIMSFMRALNSTGEQTETDVQNDMFNLLQHVTNSSDNLIPFTVRSLADYLQGIVSSYTDGQFDSSNRTQEETSLRQLRQIRSTIRVQASIALQEIRQTQLTNAQFRGLHGIVSEAVARGARRIIPSVIQVSAQPQPLQTESLSSSGNSRVLNFRGEQQPDDSLRQSKSWPP